MHLLELLPLGLRDRLAHLLVAAEHHCPLLELLEQSAGFGVFAKGFAGLCIGGDGRMLGDEFSQLLGGGGDLLVEVLLRHGSSIGPMNVSGDRYDRQCRLPQIGEAGQANIAAARVVVLGCGALGTVAADGLARAGVGTLILVDRDIVESSNLQRQTLFAESDISRPKVVAAAERLARINGAITLDPRPIDVDAESVGNLVSGVTLVVDGTDNAATRYLLNDACVKTGVPWVYGAAVGTVGRAMAVIPGETACLRCVFPNPPRPGELETCDTAGVLAAAAGVTANLQVAMAIRLIVNRDTAGVLHAFDVWHGTARQVEVPRDEACPCCGAREFPFLDMPTDSSTSLCGRDAVQVRQTGRLDLQAAAAKWAGSGTVKATAFCVRLVPTERPTLQLTAFADGRVIVQGTDDTAAARSLVARLLGS